MIGTREMQVPSKLDRIVRTALITMSAGVMLITTYSCVAWPRGSPWDLQKFLCRSVLDVALPLALCSWLMGLTWTVCSRYARSHWFIHAITWLSFALAFVLPALQASR